MRACDVRTVKLLPSLVAQSSLGDRNSTTAPGGVFSFQTNTTSIVPLTILTMFFEIACHLPRIRTIDNPGDFEWTSSVLHPNLISSVTLKNQFPKYPTRDHQPTVDIRHPTDHPAHMSPSRQWTMSGCPCGRRGLIGSPKMRWNLLN